MAKQQVVQFQANPKQSLVFHHFADKETSQVLYGGAANGGKSYGLCAFLINACLTYAKTTWLLGRCELKNLTLTTLVSFWKVCDDWGILKDSHFTYNQTKGEIEFYNGSKVILKDLTYFPSDPDCIALNGLLLTGACIDEAGEIDKRVRDIVLTRLGRWNNKEHNLKPFLLMTCNPSRNFLYDEFYKASKEGTLPNHKKFISATCDDNPYAEGYKDHLSKISTERDYQRLALGNWEYDSSPDSLIPYENVSLLWERQPTKGTKYISADIALEGSDRLVFMVWEGLTLIKILAVDKTDSVKVLELLGELMRIHRVDERNVCYDYDGLGQFIKGFYPSAKPIINNSRAKLGEEYENLKSQMYFKLAQMINEGKLVIADKTYKSEIIQELEQVRKKDTSLDRKIGIVSKATVKQSIGRSPDFSDCMAYRMLFELLPANYGKVSYQIERPKNFEL